MRTHRLGEISKLQQQCDKAFSILIREKQQCDKCWAKNVPFDTAHIINRKNLTLRWDILNCLCLCSDCHSWAHMHPKLFMAWFENKHPDRFEYLTRIKNLLSFRSTEDYEKILEAIKKKELWGLIQKED